MTGWPDTYGRFVLDDVGSTQVTAVGMQRTHTAPFWVLAKQQSAARGRRGRVWHMPEGNFAATLLLELPDPPARLALRSFVMSLALHRAFSEATGRVEILTVKWPNDVLLDGGKVAGILLEAPGPAGVLAIGVGVNLVAAPSAEDVEPHAVPPVDVLSRTGARIAPEAFLECLARHYADLERTFVEQGFAPIRAAWLRHAARLGACITARTGQTAHTGIFEDVDGHGHLVLRGAGQVQSIAAADVYF